MTEGERSEIEKVLRRAAADGLTFKYDDGGDRVRCSTPDEVLSRVGACDEEWIVFVRGGLYLGTAMLVFGNAPDGSEVFADYHTSLEKYVSPEETPT